MKNTKRIIWISGCASVILIVGASFLHNTTRPNPELTPIINEKIDRFHQQLTANQFIQIYEEADLRLRNSQSENEFVEYLRKAKEKLQDEIPKANVETQETLLNTIGSKIGRPVFIQTSFTIREGSIKKSEVFRWVIYSHDDVKLVSYDF